MQAVERIQKYTLALLYFSPELAACAVVQSFLCCTCVAGLAGMRLLLQEFHKKMYVASNKRVCTCREYTQIYIYMYIYLCIYCFRFTLASPAFLWRISESRDKPPAFLVHVPHFADGISTPAPSRPSSICVCYPRPDVFNEGIDYSQQLRVWRDVRPQCWAKTVSWCSSWTVGAHRLPWCLIERQPPPGARSAC